MLSVKLKKVIVFSLLLFTSFNVRAALGCEIGNSIYTTLNGNLTVTIILVTVSVRNFDNPSLSTLPNACPRAVNIVPVNGGLGLTTCVANGNLLPLGTVVNYDRLDPPVQCDLDDYTWTFGAAAGLFGVFVIRRRNKL
jgi:hypothetical protein